MAQRAYKCAKQLGVLVITDLRASERTGRADEQRERVCVCACAVCANGKAGCRYAEERRGVSLLCEKNSVLVFFLLEKKKKKKKKTTTVYTGVLVLITSPFGSTREYVRNVLRECSGLVVEFFPPSVCITTVIFVLGERKFSIYD